MRYIISRASNLYPKVTELPCKNAKVQKKKDGECYFVIELNTLEDLHKLIKEVGDDIIIGMPSESGYDGEITIYDDWVE